jgi:hypothetical protein
MLVLALSVFWSSEKSQRLSAENRLEDNVQALMKAESRIQAIQETLANTERELAQTKSEIRQIKADRSQLIDQLGRRDEHIRRLLAEMIQMMAGTQGVDLGQIRIPSSPEAWSGVKKELNDFAQQAPIPKVDVQPSSSEIVVKPGAQIRENIQTQTIPLGTMAAEAGTTVQIRPPAMVPIPAVGSPQASVEEDRLPASLSAPQNEDTGKILVVNSDHNFVVINRGGDDGIKEGMKLAVVRDGQTRGNLVVETVYEKICAAGIQSGEPTDYKVGDLIKSL